MSILDRFGVSEADLGDPFGGFVLGRTLVIDADAAAYKAAATAKKLDTVVRRFKTLIFEAQYLTKAEFIRVHLTPSGCYKNGRHLLRCVKPYQGNRSGKAKPPLLEPLRNMAHTIFDPSEPVEVLQHIQIEADDGVMQDAYAIPNAIVWSEDKDLNIVPCDKYDINTGRVLTLATGDRYGWIERSCTDSGLSKIKGHGTKFFWWQMLAGDTADNVQGVLKLDGKNCGDIGAFEALQHIDSEAHAANLVINAYREIDQNPLPEAEAMWLTRAPGDYAAGYIWSLDLTPANREFIRDCYNRNYILEPDDEEQYID